MPTSMLQIIQSVHINILCSITQWNHYCMCIQHYMLILIPNDMSSCTFNFHAASSTWVPTCPCEYNYSLILNTVLCTCTFIIICTGSRCSREFLSTQFWFPGRLPANKLWLFCGHGTQSCQQQLPWYPPWGWCTGMGGCWVLRGQKNGESLTIKT